MQQLSLRSFLHGSWVGDSMLEKAFELDADRLDCGGDSNYSLDGRYVLIYRSKTC